MTTRTDAMCMKMNECARSPGERGGGGRARGDRTRARDDPIARRDDEAVKLSKLLVGGYVPLLSSLILRRNAIGDDGASTLMRLLSSAWEAGAPG